MITLGTKLRIIRAVLNVGQADFARFADINQPELSKVERDQTIPYGKFVERIEDKLRLKLDDPRIENGIRIIHEALSDSESIAA